MGLVNVKGGGRGLSPAIKLEKAFTNKVADQRSHRSPPTETFRSRTRHQHGRDSGNFVVH